MKRSFLKSRTTCPEFAGNKDELKFRQGKLEHMVSLSEDRLVGGN